MGGLREKPISINNPPRLGAGNTDWRSGRAGGSRINIAATQLRKNAKKDTKSVPISGRCCWPGRVGSGRANRAFCYFEDPNWTTQNGRLLWGSVLKNVRKIAAEPVPITLGEFRRSLRSLCFIPRRFAPRGASRRFANLIKLGPAWRRGYKLELDGWFDKAPILARQLCSRGHVDREANGHAGEDGNA